MITEPDTEQKSSRASYADGPRLLADIGATHARFTLETAPGVFRQTAVLRCDDYSGIVQLLNTYLADTWGTVERFEMMLAAGSSCTVTGYVLSATSTSDRAWTVEWSGPMSPTSTLGYVASGDVGVAAVSGTTYGIGVSWTCSTAGEYLTFGFDASGTSTDGGIGDSTGGFLYGSTYDSAFYSDINYSSGVLDAPLDQLIDVVDLH